MTNELVTINQSPQLIETGLDDVAPLRPSYIRFLQPSSSDLHGGEPGQFFDETTNELYDELIVVPLQVMTNRILYPPGAEIRSGVKPLCKSDDGKAPARYIDTPQARSCQGCQYSEWVDGKPSLCSVNLKMLCLLKDSGVPRFLVAMGTSVSPLRKFLTRINEDIKIQRIKGNAVNLYDYFFSVVSERKRNYFVMGFENVQRVRELGEFGPLYEQFVRAARQEQTTVDAVASELVNEI